MSPRFALQGPPPVLQRVPVRLCRHGHREAYVAVVLRGGYREAGFGGRADVSAGHVLTHRSYDRHINDCSLPHTVVLNLPLDEAEEWPVFGRVDDPDQVARYAERDLRLAIEYLVERIEPAPAAICDDWPDLLSASLRDSDELSIGCWAAEHGLSREHVSRGFKSCFGISPKRYRMESRAREALGLIRKTDLSLSEIAIACGFCDQSHMSRAIVALTGKPPAKHRAHSTVS